MQTVMKITSRDKATSYSTREGAQIVANVLAGLDRYGCKFVVYEITELGVYQIKVNSIGSYPPDGWYANQ